MVGYVDTSSLVYEFNLLSFSSPLINVKYPSGKLFVFPLLLPSVYLDIFDPTSGLSDRCFQGTHWTPTRFCQRRSNKSLVSYVVELSRSSIFPGQTHILQKIMYFSLSEV